MFVRLKRGKLLHQKNPTERAKYSKNSGKCLNQILNSILDILVKTVTLDSLKKKSAQLNCLPKCCITSGGGCKHEAGRAESCGVESELLGLTSRQILRPLAPLCPRVLRWHRSPGPAAELLPAASLVNMAWLVLAAEC